MLTFFPPRKVWTYRLVWLNLSLTMSSLVDKWKYYGVFDVVCPCFRQPATTTGTRPACSKCHFWQSNSRFDCIKNVNQYNVPWSSPHISSKAEAAGWTPDSWRGGRVGSKSWVHISARSASSSSVDATLSAGLACWTEKSAGLACWTENSGGLLTCSV